MWAAWVIRDVSAKWQGVGACRRKKRLDERLEKSERDDFKRVKTAKNYPEGLHKKATWLIAKNLSK